MSIIQDALNKMKGVPRDKRTAGVNAGRYETTGYGYQEKRPGRLLPFLAIALLLVFSFYVFRSVSPNMRPRNLIKQAVSASVPAATNIEEKTPAPLQIQASAPVVKTPDPAFMLSGIMMLERGPRAIINGSVLEEGDTINGASVESIEREKVLLRYKGEKITLKLK